MLYTRCPFRKQFAIKRGSIEKAVKINPGKDLSRLAYQTLGTLMTNYLEQINHLIPLHQEVAGINPALHRLYPIAVAEDDQLFIADTRAEQACYHFIKHIPTPMPVPKGVRAAFQLSDYGGRIACVVTPEVFNTLEGYVTILHEFVHCYQYETCEQELKDGLDVARQAQEQGDFMWEIQHPFPYTAEAFIRTYQGFLDAVRKSREFEVLRMREMLHAYLGVHDYEYMVWQEWKEGFARWVENAIRRELGFSQNTRGFEVPFNRVTFYAGGAAYIDFFQQTAPALVNDLPRLFDRMGRL